jgi:hypothetical protein
MNDTLPDLNSRIAEWRRKQLEGTLTLDEMREAIKTLRARRVVASAISAKSKAKKEPPPVIDVEDLLSGLM